MNQINLTGRITKDLELRYTQSNKSVCKFTLAVNRVGQDETDFIICVVWGKQAENLEKYQGKGSLIGITGSLRVDKYQDKDGNNRYNTYVLANNVEYLESKKSKENGTDINVASNEPTKQTDSFAEFGEEIQISDDDLPF